MLQFGNRFVIKMDKLRSIGKYFALISLINLVCAGTFANDSIMINDKISNNGSSILSNKSDRTDSKETNLNEIVQKCNETSKINSGEIR